jgi:hypothetical protein
MRSSPSASWRGRDELTDRGNTSFKFRVNRVGLTELRLNLIDSICQRYQMEFVGGVLRKKLSQKDCGLDCLRFCEGLTRVSSELRGLSAAIDEHIPT